MYTPESKVVATFKENGSVLFEKSRFSESKKRVINAVYKSATRRIVMGIDFIESCLEHPKTPKGNEKFRFLKSPIGLASRDWKNLSDHQKISLVLDEIAHDLRSTVLDFEII